eukprot:m.601576 g.601576  ORF g.601576 m.601576 type:complete len:60 (-) comp22442_c0_seq15:2185-2364(-)
MGDHVGWWTSNSLLTYPKLYNYACIGYDMPGSGRSDGRHLLISDWFEFVATVTIEDTGF